jgi:hypothetical protein
VFQQLLTARLRNALPALQDLVGFTQISSDMTATEAASMVSAQLHTQAAYSSGHWLAQTLPNAYSHGTLVLLLLPGE